MEKHLGLEPGSCAAFKPAAPGQMPPRRSRAVVVVIEPSTPSNDRGPAVCGNFRCVDCLGPPCLSPLSRPPRREPPTCRWCRASSVTMEGDGSNSRWRGSSHGGDGRRDGRQSARRPTSTKASRHNIGSAGSMSDGSPLLLTHTNCSSVCVH